MRLKERKIIIIKNSKMGCGGGFKGFTQQEKQQMFADYSKAFKISGSEIINQKNFLVNRIIRIKETIERYPMVCSQRCYYPTFPQPGYIPQKFDLCSTCSSMGVLNIVRKGQFLCRVCNGFYYSLNAPVPCKNCKGTGLIVESRNPYK